jgi:hypothetical protein
MSSPVFVPEHLVGPAPEGAIRLSLPKQPTESPLTLERALFSKAFLESLNGSGAANFTLVLQADSATALLAELRACSFSSWQARLSNDNGTSLLNFSCKFDPPATPAAVSVIIPTFENSTEELHRSVSSALDALTAGEFPHASELIISDDGSTEPAQAKLAHFVNTRPYKIRHIRSQTNRGVAATRNRGVAQASCDIVVFLDADDALHPLALRALMAQIGAGAEVAACDMDLPLTKLILCARPRGIPEIFNDNSFGSGIMLNLKGPTLSRLFNHQQVYNPLYSYCYEDWELNCVLQVSGAKTAIVPAPLYHYYRKETGRDSRPSRLRNLVKRTLPYSARWRVWLSHRGPR